MISKPTKLTVKKWLTNASPTYYQTKRYIEITEDYSNDQFQTIQLNKLKEVLYNAYNNVPYYQRNWRAVDFHPNDFKQIEDISQLPFIDKGTCRENGTDLVSKKYNKRLLPKVYTGGTTGAPLMLYRSFNDYGRERAYTEYAYKAVGMDHRVKTVYMRGKVADESGRYHRLTDSGTTLYLSSHKLDNEQIDQYIKRIREFKPTLFYTLPSVATIIAQHMQDKQIASFETLKWIFCPSENLYDFQRKLIEKVLKCKIGMFYGHAEHAVFAIKCDHSDMYHVLPQYGYCELIDTEQRTIKEEGTIGEIVGTSFTNQVSPLVRYRTGDYATYTKKKCPCGRNYMMIEKLQGREQCLAVDKRNAQISVGPELLCTIHDASYEKIKQFRMEQWKPGELIVLIDPHNEDDYSEASQSFSAFFEKQFPGLFTIKTKRLEKSKESSNSDKHLYFVQHLPNQNDCTL